MDEKHLGTQQAVYLTGLLLADGWTFWAFVGLYIVTWVARIVEKRAADARFVQQRRARTP